MDDRVIGSLWYLIIGCLTDPHSVAKYRVNNVVANMPEFQKAWGCHTGQPMVSANMCRVW